MSEYNPDVTFSASAPIDVNKLNQLQRNIAAVYAENSAGISLANTTVGTIQQTVRVFPVVEVNTTDLVVPADGCVSKVVTFQNTNFSSTPTIVASVSSDIKPDYGLTLRATALGPTQARIEACTSGKNTLSIKISYIAIQMKVSD